MIKTIANDHLTICVKSFGAELCSVKSADGFEYMWQGDPSVWDKHSPILFPVVGRMRDGGRYQFDGSEFVMPKHGFARTSEFALVDVQQGSMTFEMTESDATLACWPFRFVLRVRYTLERDSLRVGFEVSNTDERTMYFSLGGHPAFACPLQADRDFADYHLQFETPEMADRWYVENGLLGCCQQNFFNNTDRMDICSELFDDDALIFKDLRSNTLTLASDLDERSVQVAFDGCPDLGIWSMGTGFVCIEPWFGYDDPVDFEGPFEQKPGIVSLEPGGTFRPEYRICFK